MKVIRFLVNTVSVLIAILMVAGCGWCAVRQFSYGRTTDGIIAAVACLFFLAMSVYDIFNENNYSEAARVKETKMNPFFLLKSKKMLWGIFIGIGICMGICLIIGNAIVGVEFEAWIIAVDFVAGALFSLYMSGLFYCRYRKFTDNK